MKKSIYLLLIGAVIIASCNKNSEDPIKDSDNNKNTIGVTTSHEAITAGEEQLFTFSGEINKVEFYSGEPGHVYGHESETPKELEGEVYLSFIARVMNSYEFEQELEAFVSTDFEGEYTLSAISDAIWKPLNDRITYPVTNADGPTGDGNVPNEVNITDLMEHEKPFYIAFRYTCFPRPPAPRNGRQWRVRDYLLTNESSGEINTLSDSETEEWTVLTDGEVEAGREHRFPNEDGRKTIEFRSNQGSTYEGFQTWAISRAYDLYDAIVLVPDEGVTIESPSTSYQHLYAVPGLYEATFVIYSADGEDPLVKKVRVTVLP